MVGSLSLSLPLSLSLFAQSHDTHTQSCLAEALAAFVVLVDTAATTAAVFVVVVIQR